MNTREYKQIFQAEEQTELKNYVQLSISHFIHVLEKLQNSLNLKNILNYTSSWRRDQFLHSKKCTFLYTKFLCFIYIQLFFRWKLSISWTCF